MNLEQAFAALGLDPGASQAEVSTAYEHKKSQLATKAEAAPTENLKAKFAQLINQLDQARGLVLAELQAQKSSPNRSRPQLSGTKLADLPNAGPIGESPDLLTPGSLLAGRYEVEERIGSGGMGAVYRALDRNTGEPVALKVMLPALMCDQRARERFLDEARLSQKLSHPNIVNVYDVQHDGDLYFLTMELLEGQDLRQVMENRKAVRQQFTQKELQELAAQLCGALTYAHKITVHRDIKPENIWLCEDGSYKLMDFGIARLQSTSQRTQSGVAMGTAYYMAPEQLKGLTDVDGRADLYALGVLLYELATGDVPAGLVKPLRQKRPDLGRGFANAVMRCLEAEPNDRFPDAAALVSGLSGKDGTGLSLPEVPWKAIGIAAALMLSIAGLGTAMMSGNGTFGSINFSSLLPMSKEEKSRYRAAIAKIQGEINVSKDRLDNGRRSLDSDVRDAQRNNSADLKTLEYWQQTTEQWVFGGSSIPELEGDLSMAEALLRDEAFEEAEAAFTRVRDGYQSLEENFKAGQDFHKTLGDNERAKQAWSKLGIISTPLHPEVQAASQAEDAARLAQSQGSLRSALVSWRKATEHWGKAKQAGDPIVAAKHAAQGAERSWLTLKKEYGLSDPAEVNQAREAFVKADEQLQQGQFDTSITTWKQSQASWERAKAARKDQVAQVQRDRKAAADAEAERRRLAAEAEREKQRIEGIKKQIAQLSATKNNLVTELNNRKAENERLMSQYWAIPNIQGTGGNISFSLSFYEQCINDPSRRNWAPCRDRNVNSGLQQLRRLSRPYYENETRIHTIPFELADIDRHLNGLQAQLK